MKTPEQLKGAIRNISKEKDLHAQEVLQVFMFERMEPIREDDDYNNFRVHVIAEYGKIKNKMKIDITTGDEITPAAIEYSFHTIFDEKDIDVYAYTLETILAEKYETVIRKGITNTRSRDFYDLYVLFHLYKDSISPDHFKLAVEHTAKKRGSSDFLAYYESICAEVKAEESLASDWSNYTSEEKYAARLSFEDVVNNAVVVGNYLKNIPDSPVA